MEAMAEPRNHTLKAVESTLWIPVRLTFLWVQPSGGAGRRPEEDGRTRRSPCASRYSARLAIGGDKMEMSHLPPTPNLVMIEVNFVFGVYL